MMSLRLHRLPAARADRQIHPSSKLLTVRPNAVLRRTSRDHKTSYAAYSALCSRFSFAASNTSSTANRRHCRIWASKKQQIDSVSDNVDEAEDEEYDEGEYVEGEWEEYEEWEEGDEEDEAEAEAAAAVVGTAKQIPAEATSVPFTTDDFVEVGIISKAHGVRGEVKVQLITDEPRKRLGTAGKRLWLLPPANRTQPAAVGSSGSSSAGSTLQRVIVQSGRVARPEAKDRRAEWAVKFQEVTDRDQAADLAGHKLLLALCDREAAPKRRDEFFITDLVGLKALDAETQQLIGIVTEVYDTSTSYSLLRVRLAPNEDDISQSKYRSVLVPFVTEIVPGVDVAGGVLMLSPPEGLLDTASSKKLRRPYTAEQQDQLRQQLQQRTQQQQQRQQQQQPQSQ